MGTIVLDHPAHMGGGLFPGAGGKPLRVFGGRGVVQHSDEPEGMSVDGAGDMEIQRIHMEAGEAQIGSPAEVGITLRQLNILYREQITLFPTGQE